MQNVDKTNKYETTALNRVLAAFTPRVFIESDDVVDSSSTLNKILSIMWIIPLFARILDWMILDCTPFHSSKISIKVTNNKIYSKITSSLRCSYLLYKLIWIVKNYLFYSGCERIIFLLPSVSSSSNMTLTLRTHSVEFLSPQIARIFSILSDVPLTVCRSNS